MEQPTPYLSVHKLLLKNEIKGDISLPHAGRKTSPAWVNEQPACTSTGYPAGYRLRMSFSKTITETTGDQNNLTPEVEIKQECYNFNLIRDKRVKFDLHRFSPYKGLLVATQQAFS